MERLSHMNIRSKVAWAIASVALVALGSLSLLKGHFTSAQAIPHDGETLYAELATTSEQGLPAASATTTSVHVPIVVYHIVRPAYQDDSPQVRGLAQTPEVFEAQMQHLRDAGYHVVSFHALEDYFASGTPLPEKPIIISFDDGWRDQFDYAFPILEKYGYTATFFIFTNSVGGKSFMTWSELRALRDAGMTIGSHSVSHPYLVRITDPAVLSKEINDSKKILELHLGITVNEFAYPFGQYDPAIVAAVEKAGYASARGDHVSGDQSADHRYALSALNAPTSLALFKQKFP